MSDEEKKRKASQRWRMILTWFTLVALGLLVFFLRDEIVETLSNLTRVHGWILLFMLVWQVINYHSYTRLYLDQFAIIGEKLAYKPVYKIMLELNFVNHILPSAGVSGFSYFTVRMKTLGVSTAKSTLVQMMRFVTTFISFQALLFLGLFILAVNGKANNLTILVASSIATLILVATLLMAYIVGSKRRIDVFLTQLTRFLNRLIQLLRPKHPETINIASARRSFLELHENYVILTKDYRRLKKPLFWALLASATEIATLYTVYLAFGEPVNVGAVILAYAVANFAGLISVLPGGIGVYEALMTAVLVTAGVPAALSIPVTIMYRILSLAIQLPPGYYFYHKAINGGDKRTA